MFAYIFGLFQTIWFIVLCDLFLGIFVVKRNYKNKVIYGLWIGLIVCNYFISIITMNDVFMKQIIIIVFTSIVVWIIYQQNYFKLLILLLLYQAGCILIEYTTLLVVQKCFGMTERIVNSPIASSLLGILCQMVIFCMILIMRKSMIRNAVASLTEMEWVRFSVFPLFTLISILAMIIHFEILPNEQQGSIIITIACGLLVMNVMTFGLINDIMKREVQLAENRLFYEKVKNETEIYHSISVNYEKQKKKVHEFNNHISCIMSLAQNNEYEKLKVYLGTMQADIMHTIDLIDTNHTLINAILNSKYYEAKERGITFVFKVNDLSKVILADEDIVVILSNLLNNAFEACEKCEEKIVKLKFVQEQNQIIISVINSYKITPIKNGNKFQTSKTENRELHGIGITNVKDAVEKYQGVYVIKYEENSFKFSILIPNK